MTDRRRQIIRFFLMIIYSQLLAGVQTSLWVHLFGGFTAPAFWLMIIVYVSLFRNVVDGLFNLFFISFGLSVYTSLPEGLLTLNLLILFAAARFLKSRVFIPTTIYFASTAALGVLGFSLIHLVFSYVFEKLPITSPEVWPVVLQAVVTFFFAIPVFGILQWTDHFMRDEAKEGWGNRGVDSWVRGHDS